MIFLARTVYTTLPELHDAKKKWIVANDFVETHDPKLLLASEQHSSRWGIILPAILALELNGNNLITYYSLSLVFYAVFFALMMGFARYDIPRPLLGVFTVLLFFEPMFFRASTQLQPFVFGMCYLAISLWFLLKYLERPRFTFLILSALLSFFAYGTKETCLLFVAGICLLLLIRAGTRPAFYYCLILLGLLGIETMVFNYVSGDLKFGRIEFLSQSKHMDKMPHREMHGIVDYLTRRWILLPVYDKTISAIVGLATIVLLFSGRFTNLHAASQGIILMAASSLS